MVGSDAPTNLPSGVRLFPVAFSRCHLFCCPSCPGGSQASLPRKLLCTLPVTETISSAPSLGGSGSSRRRKRNIFLCLPRWGPLLDILVDCLQLPKVYKTHSPIIITICSPHMRRRRVQSLVPSMGCRCSSHNLPHPGEKQRCNLCPRHYKLSSKQK